MNRKYNELEEHQKRPLLTQLTTIFKQEVEVDENQVHEVLSSVNPSFNFDIRNGTYEIEPKGLEEVSIALVML